MNSTRNTGALTKPALRLEAYFKIREYLIVKIDLKISIVKLAFTLLARVIVTIAPSTLA
ncbi:MAG: hypothetical protein ACI8VC_002596 [Candidatus Endobugula sp.]|jgi:hypothetical protein